MSALLAPTISDTFVAAENFAGFFTKAEQTAIGLGFGLRERLGLGNPRESCNTNLFFGFFLDGTKNNYIQAETGKNHSNVARLYDCYPGLSVPGVLPRETDWQYNPAQYTHFFKVYVPGVASPFPQIGDSGVGAQGTLGAMSGALGEQRIIWALIQAINNVHRYFLKMPLVQADEMAMLLKRVCLTQASRRLMEQTAASSFPVARNTADLSARTEFEKVLRRLHAAVSQHWPDDKTGKPKKIDPGIVKKIYVSTFGFSRGATQARAFTNWLQSLCKLDADLRGKPGRLTLGGFDVEFDFLGLFDTVASVGAGNTLGNSIAGKLFDGHGAWADAENSLRIPPGVKCLHLVAAHELRRSFPLDSIAVKGIVPEGCQEMVVPGVHSDLGCGYSPREQGRGTDSNGVDMLARIPLLLMYKAARLNGVPLKLELARPVAQDRFKLSLDTIAAYNAYIAECKAVAGPIHLIMREQARKQMEWRLYRRVTGKNPLQESASFARASTFDQNDLLSAGREFETEISEFVHWKDSKGKAFRPVAQEIGFDNEHLPEWEEIATWWNEHVVPSPAVVRFFDDYVHDSRAWFKLIPGNPDNEKELHELLAKWVKKRQATKAYNESEGRLYSGRSGLLSVGTMEYRYIPVADGLSEEEQGVADEYAKTGKIPRMTTVGREPFSASWSSWGLSGRAGYLRFRKIYGGYDSILLSGAPKDSNPSAKIAGALPDSTASPAA